MYVEDLFRGAPPAGTSVGVCVAKSG